MRRSFILLPFLLLLAACAPSRGDADMKLGAACVNAINATYTDSKDHFELQKTSFAFEKSYDGLRLRAVTLKGEYTYGASQPEEKTYTCRFTEEWSLFSYLPEFYNLERDNEKAGNFMGTVSGDTQLLLKITEEVQKALR